jgi:hypothetical protein
MDLRFTRRESWRAIYMADILTKVIPVLGTAAILAVMMAFTMAVGWASGKLIRKVLGIGGK